MDVVVKDDDPDHHPQAERHRLLTGESAAVLPEKMRGFRYANVESKTCSSSNNAGRYSRCFQHDFTHSRHRAQAVRRVLDGQVLVL